MEFFFNKEFITVHHDNAVRCVVAKWLVAPTSKEFREGLNVMRSGLKNFKTGKLVVDTTFLGRHPSR